MKKQTTLAVCWIHEAIWNSSETKSYYSSLLVLRIESSSVSFRP